MVSFSAHSVVRQCIPILILMRNPHGTVTKNDENKLTELTAEMAEQKTSGPFTVVCKDSFE